MDSVQVSIIAACSIVAVCLIIIAILVAIYLCKHWGYIGKRPKESTRVHAKGEGKDNHAFQQEGDTPHDLINEETGQRPNTENPSIRHDRVSPAQPATSCATNGGVIKEIQEGITPAEGNQPKRISGDSHQSINIQSREALCPTDDSVAAMGGPSYHAGDELKVGETEVKSHAIPGSNYSIQGLNDRISSQMLHRTYPRDTNLIQPSGKDVKMTERNGNLQISEVDGSELEGRNSSQQTKTLEAGAIQLQMTLRSPSSPGPMEVTAQLGDYQMKFSTLDFHLTANPTSSSHLVEPSCNRGSMAFEAPSKLSQTESVCPLMGNQSPLSEARDLQSESLGEKDNVKTDRVCASNDSGNIRSEVIKGEPQFRGPNDKVCSDTVDSYGKGLSASEVPLALRSSPTNLKRESKELEVEMRPNSVVMRQVCSSMRFSTGSIQSVPSVSSRDPLLYMRRNHNAHQSGAMISTPPELKNWIHDMETSGPAMLPLKTTASLESLEKKTCLSRDTTSSSFTPTGEEDT